MKFSAYLVLIKYDSGETKIGIYSDRSPGGFGVMGTSILLVAEGDSYSEAVKEIQKEVGRWVSMSIEMME